MKIALVGYGKMGRIIGEIAESRGHEIVCKTDETPNKENLKDAEVAIEFSVPKAAFNNIVVCLENKVPVVCGTTGWLERKPQAEEIARANGSAFLYGSNFSLGVNLFFALNEKLASLMKSFPEYQVQLEEIHHIHKKDAPSGTAISLAEGIFAQNPRYTSWKLDETHDEKLGINAVREGEVPGTHIVKYRSEIDEIEIKHAAFNRNGFALGAVIAAEWLAGRHGVYTMRDVLFS